MSCSYGIVLRATSTFVIVNAGSDDRVDVLIDVKTNSRVRMQDYYEDIQREMWNYRIFRVTFTADNGLVLSATFKGTRSVAKNNRLAVPIAEFVLWCESVRNDKSKALEDAVKTSRLDEEKEFEEEICAICHGEYEAEDMIGTLEYCKHSYHDECIKEWLRRKGVCPMCRASVLVYNLEAGSWLIVLASRLAVYDWIIRYLIGFCQTIPQTIRL